MAHESLHSLKGFSLPNLKTFQMSELFEIPEPSLDIAMAECYEGSQIPSELRGTIAEYLEKRTPAVPVKPQPKVKTLADLLVIEESLKKGESVQQEEEVEEQEADYSIFDNEVLVTIDHWGFLVEDEVSPTEITERRTERDLSDKWYSAVANWESFVKDKQKKKRMLRKGIPDKYRGIIWKKLSKTDDLKRDHPGLYNQLLTHSSQYEKQILLDIVRTFPKHVFFQAKKGMGQTSLLNCLKAFSVYDPSVGYCQGMGFIAAVLLLYMTEEDAFWLLGRLCSDYNMKGLFEPGFPLLHKCFQVLEQLMELFLPRLAAHFANESIVTSTYATSWFSTLFTYTLDFSLVLRIWDMVLAEGLRTVYRIALGLLKLLQPELLKLSFEEIVNTLKIIPPNKITADELMHAAFEFKLSAKKLEKLESSENGPK
eukprot:TRINITY_DN9749_c0_g1_i1.p1 TRINITY_DN9749_c0_g1~~TRINITY_DN9749_c0_g1_i1.p1  ORF type:complete len:426 (+),score=76.12 TRINITY_DN9749_c0_g1_i1:330-1607(+)